MKVQTVTWNNRRKAFEVVTDDDRTLRHPFSRLDAPPVPTDPLVDVWPDPEVGCEGFVFRLKSGREGFVHIEQVLEYNKDPKYLRDLLLYELTLEAQKRVAACRLSRREIIRRLGTSASQFYRLLDQTNYQKSIDQLLSLLGVLECEVEFVVHAKAG